MVILSRLLEPGGSSVRLLVRHEEGAFFITRTLQTNNTIGEKRPPATAAAAAVVVIIVALVRTFSFFFKTCLFGIKRLETLAVPTSAEMNR